jgi:diguanylate cyclase
MFWKKTGKWDDFNPSSPSAVRFGLVATGNLKKLIVIPTEPASQDFSSKIDMISSEVSTHVDGQFDRLAELLDDTVTQFASAQQKSFDRSIKNIHEAIREVIVSLEGALTSSDSLEQSTESSQARLENLQEQKDFEAVIAGLQAEVKFLNQAVQKHRENSKLIRSVCAKQIDELRGQVRTAERAVRTDHLTKLQNKAAFDFFIGSILQKVKAGEPYCLAILDLNGFKEINDQNGHLCGDAALVEFAKRINETFGTTSATASRIGGDEFSIVFKGNPVQFAAKLERLNDTFEKRPFVYENKKLVMSASYGFVQLRSNHSAETAIREADLAMYNHKTSRKTA